MTRARPLGHQPGDPVGSEPAHFFWLSLDLSSGSGHDAHFQRVNPAFVRTFGYSEAELLGQPFIWFVHPEDRAATIVELENLLHGQPTHGFEHRFRCRGGGFRWLSWTAVATPEALVHAAARDVTERKRSERGRALASAPRQTSPLAHTDGLLVAVTHDLQQPLTVIKGQAQVMLRRIARGEALETPRVEQSLAYINAAVNRMHGMIHELLDTALQESGRQPTLVLNPTDLVALVCQSVSEHQLAFELHSFEFDAQPPSLVAMFDAIRIQRIVGNLLSNAVKYSPNGGPIRVRVSEAGSPSGPVAEIVVQDEGLGIPRDDLPYIFDRFRRGSNVVRRIAGTGLGLAGVHQMVELHAGSISVESQEGVGSSFAVRIPVRGARAPTT